MFILLNCHTHSNLLGIFYIITGSILSDGTSSTKGVSAGSVLTSIFIYNLSQLYFGQSEPSSYFKKTLTIV